MQGFSDKLECTDRVSLLRIQKFSAKKMNYKENQ